MPYTAVMSQEWKIQGCGQTCAATGRPFADGEALVSCLYAGAESFFRKDFSASAWTEAQRDGAVSVWRSVFHAPPPPRQEALRKETAETLLRQYMAREDYSRKNAIYILAVMLERKRILVERDAQVHENGTRMLVYEHRKTGEVFLLPDPQLKLGELEAVQQEVADLLGLPPRIVNPAPASPPVAPS